MSYACEESDFDHCGLEAKRRVAYYGDYMTETLFKH